MVSTFQSNWDAITVEIISRRAPSNTILRTMDIYNPWVRADKAKNTVADAKEPIQSRGDDFQVLKYYIDQLNGHTASASNSNSVPYARVYLLFNGINGDEDPIAKGYIHTDGLHPSDTGVQSVADLLRGFGYAPFR